VSRGGSGRECEAAVLRATGVPRLAKPARQTEYARSLAHGVRTVANGGPVEPGSIIERLAPADERSGVQRHGPPRPYGYARGSYAAQGSAKNPAYRKLEKGSPRKGVTINIESPILREIVTHHQEQYPDVYAEEVQKIVHQVFGEVAACKIAHSQKLTRNVSEEELDKDYRSEQALTVALMGLLAEESVISQRLGKLGRKKTTTA
jgi:hypothetical protein